MEKMLPLLSKSLKETLEIVLEKHPSCDIINELLKANYLIEEYNNNILYSYEDCTYIETLTAEILRENIEKRLTNHARMITFRHNEFELSYLPEGKKPIYTGCEIWGRENRQTSKPARLIQKILKKEYKCKEFEDFNNWLKNEIMNGGEFKLLSGSDISYYYNEDRYFTNEGTLGNSCMRHSECEDYFGVYEDSAQMLALIKDGKLMGRAIVWTVDGKTYMDRFYTCYDYLDAAFVDYAKDHKWYIRENNKLLSDGDFQRWLGPDSSYNDPEEISLTIKLVREYSCMPYLDSFRYYNPSNNTINTNPEDGHVYLSSTDGEMDSGELFTCESCGDTEYGYNEECPIDWVYSEYVGGYLCPDCAVYCEGLDDYVSRHEETADVQDYDGYVRWYPLDWLRSNCDYTKVDKKWYHIDNDHITYDEDTDEYKLV